MVNNASHQIHRGLFKQQKYLKQVATYAVVCIIHPANYRVTSGLHIDASPMGILRDVKTAEPINCELLTTERGPESMS